MRLQAKLSGEQEPSKIQRLNSIPCVCDTNSSSSNYSSASAEKMVRKILRDMVDDVVNRVVLDADSPATSTSEQTPSSASMASTASTTASVVEIDCTQPEIRVSPAHRRTVEIDIVPAANPANPVQVSSSASSESRVVKMRRNTSEETPPRGCTSAPIAFR